MIDLRSDTVTRPTAGMRQAMAQAKVGDDVYGDDPTVNRLEQMVAERLDKEASLFVTSGTQSNLCALLVHCKRGDEYIAGDTSHIFRYEGGGGAVLGGISPQPVASQADGLPDPAAVLAAIKPDDNHFARTRLLCLENTKDGKVQTTERMDRAIAVARQGGLSAHLDGARMWNACAELGISGAELVAKTDTVSMCLSKGLGAVAGSLLSGPAPLINEARKWRKMLGGGLRQAGVLAAAGIFALEHHIDRLNDDHARAKRLATELSEIDRIEISAQDTNMVFATISGAQPDLAERMRDRGVLCSVENEAYCDDAAQPADQPVRQRDGAPERRSLLRLVTHLDISDDDISTTVAAFAGELGGS